MTRNSATGSIVSTIIGLLLTGVTVHRSGKPNEFGEGVVAEVAKTFGRFRRNETLGEFRYQLVNGYIAGGWNNGV